jgi:hypothetical protein
MIAGHNIRGGSLSHFYIETSALDTAAGKMAMYP